MRSGIPPAPRTGSASSGTPAREPAEPLAADPALRLHEFARACRTAARVVALYPSTHPAIRLALERLTEAGARLHAAPGDDVVLRVLPATLLLNGRASERPDPAVGELAMLLHGHLVGELTIRDTCAADTWWAFLQLLARSREDVRGAGGIARVWSAAGHDALALRQIDYAEILREYGGEAESDWQLIVSRFFEGAQTMPDAESLTALFTLAADHGRLRELAARLVVHLGAESSEEGQTIARQALQRLIEFIADTVPDELDGVLRHIGETLPALTPDRVLVVVSPEAGPSTSAGVDLATEVKARVSDAAVAGLMTRSIARDAEGGPQLAEAFHQLVPEGERRGRVLAMAQHALEDSPLGRQPGFQDRWRGLVDQLLSDTAEGPSTREQYERELSRVHGHAVDIERVRDDPPERINSWLTTVSGPELRRLDQQLLCDLLAIEGRADDWFDVLDTALAQIVHLVQAGDIPDARELLDAVTAAAGDDAPFAEAAREGLARLRDGPLLTYVMAFARRAEDTQVPDVSAFCRALGPSALAAVAEAMSTETSAATLKRFAQILVEFGPASHAYVAALQAAPNPAVRRSAIELLRAIGGPQALAALAAMLDDPAPTVQREALRAILASDAEEASTTVEQALTTGSVRVRETVLQGLASAADPRTEPLLIRVLERREYRGALEAIYRAAAEGLGRLRGGPASVDALVRVLHHGDWWAPFRTARLRLTAARALAATKSALARHALDEAVARGSAGVRRAARAALAMPGAQDSRSG